MSSKVWEQAVWGASAAGLGLLAASPDSRLMALGALAASVAAAWRWRRITIGIAGALLAGALAWLPAGEGGIWDMDALCRALNGTFDDFGAVPPLAALLAAMAIWLVALPVDAACARRDDESGGILWPVCLAPMAAGLALARVAGQTAEAGGSCAGWSVWEDTIAQFSLPAGVVAAVACQAAAAATRDTYRAACWTAAACGGWVLMAVGRADASGVAFGTTLAGCPPLAIAGWLVMGRKDPAAKARWQRLAAAVCALALAGLLPAPGFLMSRWGLIRQMGTGGFGVAWDLAMVTGSVVSWLLAVVVWAPRVWRVIDVGGRGK